MSHRRQYARTSRIAATLVATTLLAGVAVIPAVVAAAASTRVVVDHGRAAPPHSVAVPVPATSTFDVSLTPRNATGLNQFVTDVTSPQSAQYRDYLTEAQYVARYAPSGSSVDAVTSYFRAAGLTVSYDRASPLLVHVHGSSSAIGRAFDTTLRSARTDGAISTEFTGSATLPSAVAGAITAIDGLSTLAPPLMPTVARATHADVREGPHITEPGTCNAAVEQQDGLASGSYLPDQQAEAYGITNEWAQGDNGAGQTIAIYELANYVSSDIHTYFRCYGLSPSITTVNVDGGPTSTDDTGGTGGPEGEADLDIEEAGVLAPGSSLIVYQGTQNTATGSLDAYQAIATADIASVVTTSWGGCEIDQTPTSDMSAEAAVFEQMAAQGQTVFAAAGDAGSSDCWISGQSNRQLAVDDPASQPLVTGVGGLTVNSIRSTTPPSSLSETVWNSFGGAGGGGDSRVWPQPGWQTGDDVPSTGTRMVPDLSVMADPGTGFIEFAGGSWGSIGGTSIGSPIMAAVAATADQACGARVGDINPTIYSMASASTGFDDVTTGSNSLFDSTTGKYNAGTGYDRASGLGSPNPSTFIPDLCTPVRTASATTSTVTVSSSGTADVATGALVTVTARTVTGAAITHAIATVTGAETGGTVTVTPLTTASNAGGVQTFAVDTTVPGAVTLSVSVGPTTLTAPTITFTSSATAAPTTFTRLTAASGFLATSFETGTTLFGAATTSSHTLTQASTTSAAFNDSARFHLGTIDGAPATNCAGTTCTIAVDVKGQLGVVTNAAASSPTYTSLASRSILAREVAANSLSVVTLASGAGGSITFLTTTGQVVIATWRRTAATATFRNLSTTLHLARASSGTSVVAVTTSEFYVAARVGATVWLLHNGTTTGAVNLAATTSYVDTGTAALVGVPVLARDAATNELEVLARTSGDALILFGATSSAPNTLSRATSIATSGVTAAQFERGSTTAQSAPDDIVALFGARVVLLVDTPTWTPLNVSALTSTPMAARSLSTGTAPLVVTTTSVNLIAP